MERPALYTGCYATGHTHPLAMSPLSPITERERLQNLVAAQPIHLKLRGLLWEDSVTVAEILSPHTRRSPFMDEVITHLDTVSCWKGLSHSHASELVVWYHIFSDCLTSLVEEALRDVLVDELLANQEQLVEAFLVPRILECMSENSRRVIDIEISYLIRDMVERLDQFYAYTDMSKMVRWSASAGGLWNFLHTFLRNQDCLLETTDGSSIIIDSESTYSGSILHITGHASWHTPDVRFFGLPTSLSSGEEYRIAPSLLTNNGSKRSTCLVDDVRFRLLRSHLHDPLWDATEQCFRAIVPDNLQESETAETMLSVTCVTEFPDGVRFERQSRWNLKLHVTCSEPPPSYGAHSDNSNHEAIQDLLLRHHRLYEKMHMFDCSPDRSSLGAGIEPATLPSLGVNMDWAPSLNTRPSSNTDSSIERSIRESRIRADSVLDVSRTASPEIETRQVRFGNTMPFKSPPISSGENDHTKSSPQLSNLSSPHKRKVSKLGGAATHTTERFALHTLGYSSPVGTYKRPRQDSNTSTSSLPAFDIYEDDEDIPSGLENMTTGRMGEASTSPSYASSGWYSGRAKTTRAAKNVGGCTLPVRGPRIGGTRAVQFAPSLRRTRNPIHWYSNSLLASPVIDNYDAETPPPRISAENTSPQYVERLQNRIRNNYDEFQARRRRRDAGVASPNSVTDAERRVYENIFLDGSEGEWISETDIDEMDQSVEGINLGQD